MIIYGSRMYGRTNKVKGWGSCDHCGAYGEHTSFDGRRWGHLYFIPLIPLGSRVRVIKECKKCAHGLHVPEKEIPKISDDLHQGTKKALASLLAGNREFDDQGTTRSATAYLASTVEMLVCLRAEEHLLLILAALREKNMPHPLHMVNGRWLEFQGKMDEAEGAYRQAAECEPRDVLALCSLGSVQLNKNNPQGAKLIYEKALALSEDKLPIHLALLTTYEALKEHGKLAETYEACFHLMPALAKDKKIFKAYVKACKKAGRSPTAKP